MPFVGDTELKPLNLGEILQNGQLMRMRQQQMQVQQQQAAQQQATFGRQQDEWHKADDAEARNQAAVKLASGGDYAGADSQYGAGAGNLDTHQLIAGLQDSHRAQIRAQYGAAVPVAIQALQTHDPATRLALIHAAAPSLINAGWKPEDIAAFQPTDENLQGLIANARSAEDALKLYDAQQAKLNEPYTLGADQRRFVGDKQIAQGPPSFHSVTTPEGSISTVWGAPGSPGGSTAAAGGKLDPAQFFKEFVAPHEGGFAAHDANGAPVNFGINQSANPGVNVRTMTKDQAAQIFTNKYFAASGAADLPPALAAVVADTAYINPARAKQFLAQSGGDPAKFMALREGWMANLVQSDPQKYGRYEKVWNNRNRDLAAYSANLAGGGDAPTAGGSGPITIHGNPKPVKPEEPAPPLSPEDINYAAERYRATGQMPALGQGKSAAFMRAQIVHQARVLAQATGSNGALDAAGQADFKSNAAALTTLNRTASQVFASERTASLNGDQVLRTMGKGAAGTGVPVFNAWVQHGRTQWAGNPDVSRFNFAIQTFATETAKVLSGASGGAVTSDSARKEIIDKINNAQTPQQIASVIDQAKIDMGNRKRSLNEGLSALRTELRGVNGNQGGNQSGGGNIPTMSPEQARSAPKGTRFRTTDGRVMVRQ